MRANYGRRPQVYSHPRLFADNLCYDVWAVVEMRVSQGLSLHESREIHELLELEIELGIYDSY